MPSSAQGITRRDLIAAAATLTTGTLLSSTLLAGQEKGGETKQGQEPEVTATEDLMREHGVLRRALLVYSETIPKIRSNAAALDASALNRTGVLFRDFGEVYHEKMLEEEHIFPVVRKGSGAAAKYPDILVAQHARGREITSYLLSVTNSGRIASGNAEPLARSLEAFVLMYRNHAAREDTIVFPAWKTHFTNKQLDELSDQFEDIEHKMFGKDGFDDAVEKIAAIEQSLGLADLSQFTAPPPPKA
jgi:hemerythrin-like domain-containing protein